MSALFIEIPKNETIALVFKDEERTEPSAAHVVQWHVYSEQLGGYIPRGQLIAKLREATREEEKTASTPHRVLIRATVRGVERAYIMDAEAVPPRKRGQEIPDGGYVTVINTGIPRDAARLATLKDTARHIYGDNALFSDEIPRGVKIHALAQTNPARV